MAVRSQLLLVHILIVEPHILGDQPHDAEPLLPEAAAQVDVVTVHTLSRLLIGQNLVTDGHVVDSKLPGGYPLSSHHILHLWVPAIVAMWDQEGEVEGHCSLVLLRHHFQPAVSLGHYQPMGTTVGENTDFPQ